MMKESLKNLRRELHAEPRLSGNELDTAQKIISFLQAHALPDNIIYPVGRTGVVAGYCGQGEAPHILLRCELDALPIKEKNKDLGYASSKEGISHKCGHDGHMAILCGIAMVLKTKKHKGVVNLLFQPAEEIGEGARWVLEDHKFQTLKLDYVFALHNVPGYDLGSIVVKSGTIAPASIGVNLKLVGAKAHASEPHLGRSPALAITQLIESIPRLSSQLEAIKGYVLVTLIHVRIGQKDYGVSPGDAEISFTVRTHLDKDMQVLLDGILAKTKEICKSEQLKLELTKTDEFPSTQNHVDAVNIIKKVAREKECNLVESENPFPWSEDFGHFTRAHCGALFGLGSGTSHPNLHDESYDFPDELILKGVDIFHGIIQAVNSDHEELLGSESQLRSPPEIGEQVSRIIPLEETRENENKALASQRNHLRK